MSASYSRSAPAKVNLGLHVLRRRSDGYHDIETVLIPIGWRDQLRYREADHFRFTCSDSSLPADERNLCVRAAHALATHAGIKPRGHLHLVKNVPIGAGLGGGSSDAAHTLQLLNEQWGIGATNRELHGLAAGLGSDVPFFLHGEPMYASGRGEHLAPIAVSPYQLPFALAVVMPDVYISTAEAYRYVQPDDRDRPNLGSIVSSNDLDRWRDKLVNDFESPVLAKYSAISDLRKWMLQAGAGYAALSGSGAAVFGVFERTDRAEAAACEAVSKGLRVWVDPAPVATDM